jgi:hypothetical protein
MRRRREVGQVALKGYPACEVFLAPTAFLSMTVASAEVYSRETIGILVGLRAGAKVWVEYAVPIQTANRGPESVQWKTHIERRIQRFMTGSTGLEIVGRFHSHPWPERNALFKGMNRMSPADLKSWDPREIEVIVGVVKNGGVNRRRRALEWKHLKGGTLQGAIGQYAIKMTSWFSASGRRQPKIAYIRCPFATGMDH